MTAAAEPDLTGGWRGIFNYPRFYPPTEFEAELRETAGLLTGLTSEPHLDGGGAILHATLEGTRRGRQVRFRKTYDDFGDGYASVLYEGRVDPSGDEIAGEWTVPGVWSGTFLMIRASGRSEAAEAKHAEKVRI